MRTGFICFLFASFSSMALAEPTLLHNIKGYSLSGPAGNQAKLISFSSLVFDEGKLLLVGEESTARETYPNAKRIDGKGKFVLPGLIDAHGHILGLGQNLLQVDLRGTQSEAEAVKRVQDYARNNPKLKWLIGRGWNQVLWDKNEFPGKESLDALSINKPIVLSRVDSHATWVNSKALEIAGIDRNTPDPDGGQIIKDANGDPTGVLIDNAELLVTNNLPAATPLELNYALDTAFEHLLSLGITSTHDAGIDHDIYQVYQQRQQTGQLPMRVYAMLSGSSDRLTDWLGKGIISDPLDQLYIRSVKLYADGALGSRGAAMIEPYSDHADHRGLLVTQPAELNQLAKQVINAGFQVNIHAIGDLGNRVVIEAISQAAPMEKSNPLRHRIEHAQIVELGDLDKIKQLNLIASMQPTHATSDMNMAEDRVGAERIKGAYAWRTLLDKQVIIAAGSDFPVELANPFFGLHAAVTRQSRDNMPAGGWIPEQAMTLQEALRTFTLDAAYAAHQEESLGSLEKGKWADFILVDRDIFNIDPKTLWQVKVLETWVAGRQVFKK